MGRDDDRDRDRSRRDRSRERSRRDRSRSRDRSRRDRSRREKSADKAAAEPAPAPAPKESIEMIRQKSEIDDLTKDQRTVFVEPARHEGDGEADPQVLREATETDPTWRSDIRDDVTAECGKYGPTVHVHVDAVSPRGLVHVLFRDADGAAAAAAALHGRWFAGRAITCVYVAPETHRAQFAAEM
ncbi:RNA-binding protein [Aureococcus anophagefferens]|uniref:RNA-binding protein n=1 Tax=Aureococcus anophagefferens TaxID=44056 RepID=A0ABR1FS23_AURAN